MAKRERGVRPALVLRLLVEWLDAKLRPSLCHRPFHVKKDLPMKDRLQGHLFPFRATRLY